MVAVISRKNQPQKKRMGRTFWKTANILWPKPCFGMVAHALNVASCMLLGF
jgi:hypothetical protein